MALMIEDKNSSPTSVFDLETLYDTDKKTTAVYLPQDVILFQIITRVPPKSVIRFKCVSKQWNSFLLSDRFKKMHNRNHLKEPHLEDQNLIFFYDEAAELTFYTIDCELLPVKAPRHLPVPQFEASPPEYMTLLASYHGLVCLRIKMHDYQDSYIILWNPLTTEYKRLSKPSNPDYIKCIQYYGYGYGLYYSSCEDDYKLLLVSYNNNVYIYSLKSDSWRKLNKKPPFQAICSFWEPGFCLNENIYFVLKGKVQGRFETTTERFHKIKTPPVYDNNNNPRSTTIIHRGAIHSFVQYDIGPYYSLKSTCIELWKLNVDEDIWSKVVTYRLLPNHDIRCLSPLHLMRNGNWLMINEGRIFQVDLKKKEYTNNKDGHKRKGKNKRERDWHDEYKLHHPVVIRDNFFEQSSYIRYTETFVSPNQYMK